MTRLVENALRQVDLKFVRIKFHTLPLFEYEIIGDKNEKPFSRVLGNASATHELNVFGNLPFKMEQMQLTRSFPIGQ